MYALSDYCSPKVCYYSPCSIVEFWVAVCVAALCCGRHMKGICVCTDKPQDAEPIGGLRCVALSTVLPSMPSYMIYCGHSLRVHSSVHSCSNQRNIHFQYRATFCWGRQRETIDASRKMRDRRGGEVARTNSKLDITRCRLCRGLHGIDAGWKLWTQPTDKHDDSSVGFVVSYRMHRWR